MSYQQNGQQRHYLWDLCSHHVRQVGPEPKGRVQQEHLMFNESIMQELYVNLQSTSNNES